MRDVPDGKGACQKTQERGDEYPAYTEGGGDLSAYPGSDDEAEREEAIHRAKGGGAGMWLAVILVQSSQIGVHGRQHGERGPVEHDAGESQPPVGGNGV